MGELWVKWKHRLIFGVCAWVLLGFIVLMERSSSHLFSSQALYKIWRILGDLILFKGVSKYQDLIAGFAALCGGAFVILAAKQQIDFTKRDKIRESRADLKNIMSHHKQILSLLSVEFSIVANFLEKKTLEWHDREFSWINAHAIELVRFDPALLETVRRAESLLRLAIIEINTIKKISIFNSHIRNLRWTELTGKHLLSLMQLMIFSKKHLPY